jgi:hypothetical protein
MLARSRHIFMPIDQTMDRYWENGIAPYVLRPLPVWHEGVLPSEIGKRGRAAAAPPGKLDLLTRRAQRLIDGLNKRLFWLTYSSNRGEPAVVRLTVGRIGAVCAALVTVLMIVFLPAPR